VPGFYDAQVSSVQKLITGELGPHEVLTELADYYRENLAGVGG
jgi:raffinose/stachyose/melibiose transport system substrate-binding protein